MRSFIAVLLVLCCGTALACPVCDSETGDAVRAGIFDGNFWSTLISLALPFPILLGIVAAVHFGSPRPQREGQ